MVDMDRRPAGSIRRGSAAGYTVAELQSVLVVLLILGAVVVSGVIGRIDAAHRDAERTSLTTLVDSVAETAIRMRCIPAEDQLAPVLAGHLGQPLERVTTNALGRRRLFLYDPDFRGGPAAGGELPYRQTAEGVTRPIRLRGVIVSSLGEPLPDPDRAAAAFGSLWNAASNSVPSEWVGLWSGHATDLQIARFDLTEVFRRVVLENQESGVEASYSVDAEAPSRRIPAGTRREFWLMTTSVLELHSAVGAPRLRTPVSGETRWAFRDGVWRP